MFHIRNNITLPFPFPFRSPLVQLDRLFPKLNVRENFPGKKKKTTSKLIFERQRAMEVWFERIVTEPNLLYVIASVCVRVQKGERECGGAVSVDTSRLRHLVKDSVFVGGCRDRVSATFGRRRWHRRRDCVCPSLCDPSFLLETSSNSSRGGGEGGEWRRVTPLPNYLTNTDCHANVHQVVA